MGSTIHPFGGDVISVETEFCGRKLIMETGRLAFQADGAVLVRYGESVVLGVAGVTKEPLAGFDYFPLMIDYEEKMYAAGKISGSRFIKREGRPSEEATLTSRLIDRPIRPLFPDGFRNEVQGIAMVLSLDPEIKTDTIAMLAISAAIKMSGAPFAGPIGGVRIGLVDNKLTPYPTTSEIAKSDLDLTVAGTADAIMMVEAGANEVDEKTMVEALELAHKEIQPAIKLQNDLLKKLDVKEWEYTTDQVDEAIVKEVDGFLKSKLGKNIQDKNLKVRLEKISAIKEAMLDELVGGDEEKDVKAYKEAFNKAFEYSKKSGNIYQSSTIAIRMAENEQQLGNYKSGYKKCSDLLEYLKDKGYLQITKAEWIYAGLYFIMGITEFMWAEKDKALKNLKTAYELSKGGNDIYLKTFILMSYSAILKELGDTDANQKANELEELLKHNQIPPFLESFYIGWKSHLAILNNDFEKAIEIMQDHGLGLDKEKTHANEAAYASYVRILLEQDKLDEAGTLISELHELASEGGRIERILELQVSKAILLKRQGNKEEAVEVLMDILEIAADQNLISYFVYFNDRINDLLTEAFKMCATTKTNIPKSFIDNLKKEIEKAEGLRKNKPEIEISSRELDTLKLIAENLTNQQIADKLFISLNTVKTHLKNIYLKLNVDSRTKAVIKAKEHGLL